MTDSNHSLRSLRPSEKVQRFFDSRLVEAHGGTGTRLPTIKEIARHLDVGVSTVQAVFARLAGEGKVVTIPGKGTFLAEELASAPLASSSFTVIIREHQLSGKESTWGKEICSSILREATNSPLGKMTLQPFFPEGPNCPARLEEEAQRSVGAILFPDPLGPSLHATFRELGKPVIHITPSHPRATESFVGPDFYDTCRRIGACWRQTGRRHVALLLHMPLSVSATCTLSLAGLQAGFQGEDGLPAGQISYQSIDNDHPNVPGAMEALYRTPPYPDAIYSTGDFIAAAAVEWLLERGFSVPAEVSVIGGTGLHPVHGATLACTVFQQPFEGIGREAVRMLIDSLPAHRAPLPGQYLPATVRIGMTTTPEENRLLS